MNSFEAGQNLERCFNKTHKDFIAALKSVMHTLQEDGFSMENCWEICDQLDLLDSLLGDMEELGPEMVLETPQRTYFRDKPRCYFLGYRFPFDCLAVQTGLDDARGILADCVYDDCAEVARMGLETLLGRFPF
ncbi:hypothetical protein N7447_004246 [Penicillium robsamsonii]|uniref:uncharacterized protein n=1 Tax=Penicillium robsamsonii TaxID=1792511 RepID=UPI002548AF04|nr:uncharacterized protein N7447_004246 [Penicillium robsamsonii]KAJ5827483.1 hypothetical protein N7447_004246 [Penicillium robsamsonii]